MVVDDANWHVKEYLRHYIGFPYAPRYAVMLDGAWGIGKTFLIRSFLDQHFGNDAKDAYHYISLYGVTDLDELDAALLAAMYPILGKKGTKLAGRVIKTALKAFSIEPDLTLADIVNKFQARLYVFDDLERCELPINKIMGYINEFVEHNDCKVVLIANEAEIQDQAEYRRRREKLIGKTLEVRSSLPEALAHFINGVDDPFSKSLFQRHADVISEVFQQSKLDNLRILQQTMWDFEHFSQAMSEEHKRNEGALLTLLRMTFAFSFELKSGRLESDGIKSRMPTIVAMMRREEGSESTPMQNAALRYPDTDLDDSILSDQLLIDLLVKGAVNEVEIRESLDRSSYFVPVESEPAWRVVWHWLERSEAEFNRAVTKVENQFFGRNFVVTGEILHVFGLRLWLSDIGIIERSRTDVMTEAKQYVDDLYTQGLLQSMPGRSFDNIRFDGHGGLGIHESDTPEYREVFTYLRDKQFQADRDKYPEQAADLLTLMQSDVHLFVQRICLTNSNENRYYNVPVLSVIEPMDFVSTLLSQEPAQQRIIMSALKSRYEYDQFRRDLISEAPWARAICEQLASATASMSTIGRFRIEKLVEWNLRPALANWNDGKDAEGNEIAQSTGETQSETRG